MQDTIILTSNTSWYLLKFRKGTILRLIADGFKVVCIASRDSYSTQLEDLGVKFVEISMIGKSINPIKEFFTFISIFLKLRKIKPKFVFNHTIKMNIYSGLSCLFLKVKYSNNISGLGTVYLHKNFIHLMVQKIYGIANSSAHKVFFQNQEDLDLFIERRLVNIKQIELTPGSGINLNDFKYTPLPKNKPIVFIMIARLIADKGVREFINAARIVKKSKVNAIFFLVGPSEVSNKSAISRDEILSWQKDGTVQYFGHQDDVKPFLRKSHVLVLPSYREGMPRTVLEAASIGRPSIVADVPGCRQAVQDGITGWYCEVKSEESLAKTMFSVIDMPIDQLDQFGLRARARVEEKFSEDIVISQYLNILPF